jgi:hypothetical protein
VRIGLSCSKLAIASSLKLSSVIEHVAMIFSNLALDVVQFFSTFLQCVICKCFLFFQQACLATILFRRGGWAHRKNYLLPFHSFCLGPTNNQARYLLNKNLIFFIEYFLTKKSLWKLYFTQLLLINKGKICEIVQYAWHWSYLN